MDHEHTVAALAEVLTEVNALHPFREGNGRAQRAFFRQLVAAAGWRLDWSGVDPRDNVAACEQAMVGWVDSLIDVLAPRLTRLA